MINQEEYEVLKALGDKWKWIARDGFKGELNVYNVRPTRSNFKNWWLTNKLFGRSKTILPYFFPFIQWTDSEPYFIPDLTKEYEDEVDVGYTLKEYAEYISKFSEKLLTEMEEEEMKKDKEWLKEEIESKFHRWYNSTQSLNSLVADVNNSIDQLGEPKVTEVPVVPEEVYEYMTQKKRDRYTIQQVFYQVHWNYKNESMVEEEEWVSGNEEEFAKAWLAYPNIEVEKKPLYYVSERDEEYGGFWFLSKNNNGDISIGVNRDWSKVDWDRLKLTEQEIKDYDPRYWAFRNPVEEL